MTPSAYVQARKKIKWTAFQRAFREFNDATNVFDDNDYQRYRLYAVDGTDVNLAYRENSASYVANGPNKGHNQLHVNALYDICNGTYLDAVIQTPSNSHEQKAAMAMINANAFPKNSIILADRGYAGFAMFETVNRKDNLDYLIRVKNDFCSATKNLAMTECDVDRLIELRGTQRNVDKIAYAEGRATYISSASKFGKHKKSQTWPYETPFMLSLRIVRFALSTGEYETIITSLDRSRFPLERIKELYHLRWGIETSFRTLKYDMGLAAFHSKKEQYVLQEIFARLIGYNFAMRAIKKVSVYNKAENKYEYRIDIAYAMYATKKFIWKPSSVALEEEFKKHIIPYRPGRKDKRKLVVPKAFVPFIYRVA